jgi:hypothetical protein
MSNKKLIKIFTSWRFLFFLLWKLPMVFIAGIRVKKLNQIDSVITVPYNYINKNPFNSMYFAVQAMAAELSTGCLVLLHTDKKNISTLVTGLESKYYKKAISKVEFICLDGDKISNTIDQLLVENISTTCVMTSKGYDLDGECVSEFNITWSLKKRRN